MQAAQKRTPAFSGWRQPVVLVALFVYFLTLEWERVSTYFAADDMMNLATYFWLGPWDALKSQFLLWQGFYRPMGSAFYLPLYHWFGLNPAPFQAAVLLILAANILLAFRFALALGSSQFIAGIAALLIAYHAGLPNLHYNVDMIYDVLCFCFFIGALLLYASIRSRHRYLRWYETAAFLALYLCALNSKEMALTMPLVLLAYEWTYQLLHYDFLWGRLSACGPDVIRSTGRQLFSSLRDPGRLVLFTAVLALASLYGKKFGVQPILDQPAYQPVLSLQRYMAFQKASLFELSGHLSHPGWRGVLLFWTLATWMAWRRPRPLLRFTWAYMLLTPLPVAFLSDRTQGCLYLPLVGWAIFAAAIFSDGIGAAQFSVPGATHRALGPPLDFCAAHCRRGSFLAEPDAVSQGDCRETGIRPARRIDRQRGRATPRSPSPPSAAQSGRFPERSVQRLGYDLHRNALVRRPQHSRV